MVNVSGFTQRTQKCLTALKENVSVLKKNNNT